MALPITSPKLIAASLETKFSFRCSRMLIKDRPPWLRYTTAILLVGLALGVAKLIPWLADPSHFSLFFVAAMLSSWYGGVGAAPTATMLSALFLDRFFIANKHFIPMDL